MSRPKTEINPIRAERIKTLIQREHITQQQLAERIYQTQQNISRIMTLKSALTEETARAIVKAFPEYRLEWLLGYDDSMIVSEFKRQFVERNDAVNAAVMTILDAAVREVCAREGMQMMNPESRKNLHIVRLTEMRQYYIQCAENAMPGGRAWAKFQSYVEALDAAIAAMSGTEGEE